MKIMGRRLQQAFDLTLDLAREMTEAHLKLKLKELPSNTMGAQLWCVIGARESYLKAIVQGGWAGFSCSLDDPTSKNKVLACLEKSAGACLDYVNDHEPDEKQVEYLFAMLEHEIQHHGQLIRYFYGNQLPFPKSWKARYTV